MFVNFTRTSLREDPDEDIPAAGARDLDVPRGDRLACVARGCGMPLETERLQARVAIARAYLRRSRPSRRPIRD
jgi:hypothetical protein